MQYNLDEQIKPDSRSRADASQISHDVFVHLFKKFWSFSVTNCQHCLKDWAGI